MKELIRVKFDGKIFDNKNFDLRDIQFLSKKVSNFIDKSYLGYTGKYSKNSDLRNKYKIVTKDIKHSSLEFELMLDFGMTLTPILMSESSTVSEVFKVAIEKTLEIGEKYKSEKGVSISSKDSTINYVVVNGNENNIKIPTAPFNSMLLMDNDLKDISTKMTKDEICTFEINGNNVINKNQLKNLNYGIKQIEYLKEEYLNTIYSAQIKVFEFNKQTLTGKATIENINSSVPFEYKDTIDLEIPRNMNEIIITSLMGDTINVEFKSIIENQVSKKVLKKMILI